MRALLSALHLSLPLRPQGLQSTQQQWVGPLALWYDGPWTYHCTRSSVQGVSIGFSAGLDLYACNFLSIKPFEDYSYSLVLQNLYATAVSLKDMIKCNRCHIRHSVLSAGHDANFPYRYSKTGSGSMNTMVKQWLVALLSSPCHWRTQLSLPRYSELFLLWNSFPGEVSLLGSTRPRRWQASLPSSWKIWRCADPPAQPGPGIFSYYPVKSYITPAPLLNTQL